MTDDTLSPERVGRYYDEWTARYQASFGDTFQACRPTEADDLHRYLLEHAGIVSGERILDAGCGVCGPSRYFAAHRDITVDALTVSAVQVEKARQLVEEAGLASQITVHLGDFHRLDEYFPALTFDRVLFLESLSHASEPAFVLQGAFEVLRPGGVVYIKDFFEKPCSTQSECDAVRAIIDRVDRTFAVRTPDLQRTIDTLKGVGFREVSTEPVGFVADIGRWRNFNQAHQFDLYDGKPAQQWSDWMELKFEKPS